MSPPGAMRETRRRVGDHEDGGANVASNMERLEEIVARLPEATRVDIELNIRERFNGNNAIAGEALVDALRAFAVVRSHM